MRNTIHLFASEDLRWMRPLLAERPLRPAMTRFEQLGMDEAAVERQLDLLRERLERGPLPRAEARELLISSGLDPGEGSSRIYWLFHVAALRGVLAVSPALDQKQTFVVPRPRPSCWTAHEGYAPARPALPRSLRPRHPARPRLLGQVHGHRRRGAAGRRAGEPLEEVQTGRGPMSALPGRGRAACRRPGPVVRLLPVWENYLLGYEDRTPGRPRAA